MKIKTVACIIARTSSSRLPLKVLRDIHPGITVLDFLIQRIQATKLVDEIYLCTSRESSDDILDDVAIRNGIKIYRGSADLVIERLQAVREISSPEYLIRLTGDNPFIDPELLDAQIEMVREEKLDYVRLTDVPLGATGEVIRATALDKLRRLMDPSVSEYMMLYIFDPANFKCGLIKPLSSDYSSQSITIDTPDDLKRARQLASHLIGFNDFSLHRMVKELEELFSGGKRENTSDFRVKMPYGKTIMFSDFQKMMDERKSASTLKRLYEE